MEPKAQAHLDKILREAHEVISRKYEIGQKEHGGVLPEKSSVFLVNCAVEEAVDQLVYLLTLREQILDA